MAQPSDAVGQSFSQLAYWQYEHTYMCTLAGTCQKHWLSCFWRSDTYCVAHDQVREVKYYLRAPQQPPILYSPSETHWHHQHTWPLTLTLSHGAMPKCRQCGFIRPSLPNAKCNLHNAHEDILDQMLESFILKCCSLSRRSGAFLHLDLKVLIIFEILLQLYFIIVLFSRQTVNLRAYFICHKGKSGKKMFAWYLDLNTLWLG